MQTSWAGGNYLAQGTNWAEGKENSQDKQIFLKESWSFSGKTHIQSQYRFSKGTAALQTSSGFLISLSLSSICTRRALRTGRVVGRSSLGTQRRDAGQQTGLPGRTMSLTDNVTLGISCVFFFCSVIYKLMIIISLTSQDYFKEGNDVIHAKHLAYCN